MPIRPTDDAIARFAKATEVVISPNNYVNIVTDFEIFMSETTNKVSQASCDAFFAAFMCGVITAISPQSNFNSKYNFHGDSDALKKLGEFLVNAKDETSKVGNGKTADRVQETPTSPDLQKGMEVGSVNPSSQV